MKKQQLFLLVMLLTSFSFVNSAYAITVKTIGPTGDFASITAALTNLQTTPATDALVWELQAGYTSAGETFPITFSAANLNGINATNTLTIRPASDATGLTISNSTVTITVLLSGASYVNFDGRPGGIGTAKELTIINTFATAQAAVQLQNTSHHNTFRYVSMKGQNLYVLTFYGIGVTGLNTNNTIDYCDISNAGTGNLQAGVFSYSNNPTQTSYNQNNTISNCNIYDFFSAIGSAYGINLATGNSNWTITGNSLYQTAPRPMPFSAFGISVSGTNGTNFIISNNYIGGSAPNAGGTPWTISSGNASFYGMYFLTNTTTPAFNATITNNTITNLDITNSNNFQGAKFLYISSSATSGLFTFTGNTIGSSSAADAIVLRGGTSTTTGIEKIGNGQSVNFSNNTIGGITTTAGFYGINLSGTTPGVHTINGNTIGSATVANSIKVGSAATGTFAMAISNNSNVANSISNNTVANITNLYEGTLASGYIKGIYFSGSGVATVNGNSIFNLICKSSQPGTGATASVIGIHKVAITGACSISQNLIYGLENQAPTGAVHVAGISITGTSGSATVARNTIYGLSLSTTDPTASMSGCFMGASLANFQNNVIRLGTTANGNDITTGYAINGIHNSGGSVYYYFNTLNISGSNVAGTTSPTCALNGVSAIANLQNNVLVNTRSGGVTGKHYALKLAAVPTIMDNNDYFVSGGTGFLNAMGASDYTDLATWKSTAVAGKDLVSLNVDPAFTSVTNMIPTNGAIIAGVPISGITVDHAGTTRAAIPTMGAFEAVACSNPTSGGTIVSTQEGCNPFDPALISSTAPASGFFGNVEYKWQQSTTSNNAGFTDILASNAVSYDPGPLTQTTWFKRLSRVDCKADWVGAAESNVAEMIVHPVPVLTSAPTASVCSGSSPAIALTASVESTFAWTLGTVTGTITGASDGSGTSIDQVLTNAGLVAGTVEYLVTPTSVAGSCAGAATPVTVTVNPIKGVSVSIIGNSSVCENTLVNYAAFPVNAGASPTYSWKVDGIEQGTNNTFSYTPDNGDVVTCEVTPDPAVVCPSVSVAVSNAIIMTVNPNTATIAIATNASSVCTGGSLIFNATPTNEGASPVYQWKVNGLNAGTNSPQFTYTAPNYLEETIDVITCEMVSSSSCATGRPVSSNAVNITVGPSLTPSVSISADFNPVCDGSTVVFTATPTNEGINPVYVWKVNNELAGSNENKLTYIPANDDVVTCEMTPDVAGTCIVNSVASSNTITMVVNPTSASVSITADQTTVCEGTSVKFTATTSNGGDAPTYQWKVNGGEDGNGLATFSYTPVNGDVVTCELTSNAPCVAATPVSSTPVTITVDPVLTASVTISADANPVCEGTSVTFTPSPVNAGTAPVYEWYNKGVLMGTGDTYTYAPADGDVITVRMTSNASPCLTNSPATSPEVMMTVNPTLRASVTISADANPVCAGTSVTFTSVPVNEGTEPTYQWYVNGTQVSTESSYSYIPVTGDIIHVLLTSNASPCLAGSPATSNDVVMVVNPTLNASVTISESQNNVCHGTEVTFTPTPVNGGLAPTYKWFVNDLEVFSGSSYSYVPVNDDRVYAVMTSNATPCLAGSPATSPTITMNVYPNAMLQATINDAQLTNDNDGVDETQSLTVCNVKAKNLFYQFAEIAGITPSTLVKVVANYTLSNVIVGLKDGVFALTAPVSESTNVRLSNAALPGTLVMRYRVFIDGNNNNVVDNNECAGDWIVYTVTLNPALKAPSAIIGSLTIAPGSTQDYSVEPDASATSYSWAYSGKGASIIPTNALGNAVSITFASNTTAGILSVKAVNACGESPISSIKLRLTKSAELVPDPDAEEEVIAMNAYSIRNIEIRIEGTVEGGAIATLYDMTGRVVANKVLEKGNVNTLPLQGIKTAIYILSVSDQGRVWTTKLPVRE